jgi:subtilisin
MASPHGAGVAAQILRANSSWGASGSTFGRVRSAMLNNAEGTTGWNNTSGNAHSENFLKALR